MDFQLVTDLVLGHRPRSNVIGAILRAASPQFGKSSSIAEYQCAAMNA